MVVAAASEARAQNADDILNGLGEGAAAKPKSTEAPKEIEAEPVDTKPKTEPAAAPATEAEAGKPAAKADSAPSTLDRVKAVPRKAMLKRRRFELTPMASTSLNDPYYQHLALSGSIIFYPHDAFGIGVGADYLWAHVETSNVQAVRQDLIAVPAVFELPRVFAHLDAYWIPVYGKLSLFNAEIVNFDFYATAGMGVTMAGSRRRPAVSVGVGQRFLMGDWIALRIEVRDQIFNDSQEVGGVPRSDIQSYLMVLAGLSLFVPPSFEFGGP